MKKIVLFSMLVLLLFASTALAESIAGKVGVTLRGGASYIFKSEFLDTEGPADKDIKPDIGWTAGGGIMYGITDNLAVNFDVSYLQTELKYTPAGEYTLGTAKTIDFALGAQWRFMPKSRFVPYVGVGLDVLMNKIDVSNYLKAMAAPATIDLDVDTTYGGHLSVGGDFFITPNIALNAEIRGLYSTKGDITQKFSGQPDEVIAEYNPTNVSGFLGIRFFFGGAKETTQPIAKEVVPEPAPAPAPPPPAPAPIPPPPPPPVEEMKKAPEAAAVVEQTMIEKGRVTMNVEFDTGKAIVKPAYYKEIEGVADVMKKYPELKIVVEGHTDNIGGEKYNLKLSQKRAEAIKEVMVKNFQIESSRITAKGFGYSHSIGDNKTKAGRQSNRRVEAAVEYEYTVKK